MADVTTQTQFVREAPEIEAYKVGLLQLAKQRAETPINLADPELQMQVAGLSPQQMRAMETYESGIGSYQPYFADAYSTIGQGIDTTRQGISLADEAVSATCYTTSIR